MMRRAFVVGRSTETNARLAAAFAERGFRAYVGALTELPEPDLDDVVLARLDVLPTLDGVEDGLWALGRPRRRGATLLNSPLSLLSAHDKLATARILERSGIPHPVTTHVREPSTPQSFGAPYVIKPRFGSWGRDVFRCDTPTDLLDHLARLAHRRWFRRQGAIVQELVPGTGSDLRLVVAGGRVIGGVERLALPGEWRTNVSLGAIRRRVEPSREACSTALRAAVALGIDLAGVDLVRRPNGNYLVLEVNGAVDLTEEYGLSGTDPFLSAVDALVGAGADEALAAAT
jgi:RimK family alpha-L-glutamate ligase